VGWNAALRDFNSGYEMVAFIKKDGVPAGAAVAQTGLRIFAPVLRPGKMFYAAQNFQEHVEEMIRAGMTPAGGPKFTGEKSTTAPYLFLKARPDLETLGVSELCCLAVSSPQQHNFHPAMGEPVAHSSRSWSARC
jgi:hypothetical protein